MDASEIGQQALRAFATEWFGLDGLRRSELAANEPTLAAGLINETELFVDTLMASENASFTDLLSARHTFLNDEMATHYGVSLDGATDVGGGWYRVAAPEGSGLLTQGSFLSQHPGPVHRGLTIRSLILCGSVPGPDGIDTTQIPIGDTESDRSKTQKRLDHPTCGGCHRMMDPIGLVFDPYDSRGVVRTEDEHGNPLSGDGEIIAADVAGPVSSPAELGDLLASSNDVRECVSEQLFAWSYGRAAQNADACMIEEIRGQLDENQNDLRRALIGIVATEQFVQSVGGEL